MTAIIPLEALEALEKRAEHFAGASLSRATKRAYESDWRQYHEWCAGADLEELPATPETICVYLSAMADDNAAVSTIVRRLTSIAAIHRAAGHDSPTTADKVKRVLKGIKRECGAPPEQSKALSWAELGELVKHCDSLMIGLRDRALLALGWASALRRSELVALDIGDLEFAPEGLIITVRRSKTDQEGRGYRIGIPSSAVGLCPVEAVRTWIQRRSEKDLPPGDPLFVKLGIAAAGKWWHPPRGRLSDRMVSAIVKRYAAYAGMRADLYSAHSLRRGLATEAGARGVPERVISRHTRHRSIAVLRSYIEEGTIWSENPLSAIYRASSSPLPGGE
jgi:site-specific recombinase XerD